MKRHNHFRFAAVSSVLFLFYLFCSSSVAIAQPYFTISEVYLPKIIAPNATGVASYLVKNNTGLNLTALGVSNYTSVLSQNTAPNHGSTPTCTYPIALTASGAGSQCLLQVSITGPVVNWLPQVCANIPPNNVYCSQPPSNDLTQYLTVTIGEPTLQQNIIAANQASGGGGGGTGTPSVLTFLTTDNGNVSPTYTLHGNPAFVDPFDVYIDNAQHLWVADINANGNTGAIYKFNKVTDIGTTMPVTTITGSNTTLDNPYGIAIDNSGKIYVSNWGDSKILIFSQQYQNPGTYNVAPSATISGSNTELANPQGLAFDSQNRLYVANSNENSVLAHPNVAIYAAGATGNATPQVVLPYTSLHDDPVGIALDSEDNLWVSNYGQGLQPSSNLKKFAGPVNAVADPTCVLQGLFIDGPVGIVVNASYIWTTVDLASGAIEKFDNPTNCSGTMTVSPVGAIVGSNTTLSRTAFISIYTVID